MTEPMRDTLIRLETLRTECMAEGMSAEWHSLGVDVYDDNGFLFDGVNLKEEQAALAAAEHNAVPAMAEMLREAAEISRRTIGCAIVHEEGAPQCAECGQSIPHKLEICYVAEHERWLAKWEGASND